MAGETIPDVLRSRLELQGFSCGVGSSALASARWLRFTPTLSMVCVAVATAWRSAAAFWAFAAVAASGAAGWHPFDALFNAVVRPWVRAPRLPRNPAPRRFAMLVAAVWSAGTGWLFFAGHAVAGIVAGVVLILAAALVVTTHFCLGSWIYRLIWRGHDGGARP